MTTMAQIRQQFPHPRTPQHLAREADSYCIGGAVCRVAYPHLVFHFPIAQVIGRALRRLNPALSAATARHAAFDIMGENDREAFESAWQVVDRALSA
jgi:hypothetical protein